jgi:hypothetical protein
MFVPIDAMTHPIATPARIGSYVVSGVGRPQAQRPGSSS